MRFLGTIPSPTVGVWHVAGVPIRAYAMCILVGIVVAIVVGEARWRARGGRPGVIMDVAVWAVPFGVLGGRLYHVVTSPAKYFGADGDPVRIIRIWEGGLGIWGAIALGGVGAWIGCRKAGVRVPPFGDAVAPGIALAQAVGRWGNWFNNELYGRETTLPWGLRIHEWNVSDGQAIRDADGQPVVLGTYHPTFLYECLWDVAVAVVLVLVDRRYRLGHGRVFALYVVLYTAGRAWVEILRIDESVHVLGLRLNVWTSIVVLLGGLVYLALSARLRPGREERVERGPLVVAPTVQEGGTDAGVSGQGAEEGRAPARAGEDVGERYTGGSGTMG